MLRRLQLLGLALCGLAQAATPLQIDLAVTPAWKGWSRPGRATELDVRLSANAATKVTLELAAGRQSVRADVDLQPGRAVRLHIPAVSAEKVVLTLESPTGPPQRRDIAVAQSESPVLGVGLSTGEPVQLDGFHTIALAADDLPRNASAYSSVDALILDVQTLGALDQRQLAALLEHAAQCGRIVVLNADARVRRLLGSAGGCGGRTLMSATSLVQAKDLLGASLAESTPATMSLASVGELARPANAVWNRVTVGCAVYFAAAALALLFFSSWPVLLLSPALVAVAALALLHTLQPSSQLLVWSEGGSGAQVARYQAWQQFPGLVRDHVRVPIPPQLGSSAQPCDANQAMRFDFDAERGRAAFADFDARLFRPVSLCYSGSFPMTRAIVTAARDDGSRDVTNAGATAWPAGVLLAGGLVHELPALAPGARTVIGSKAGRPPGDGVTRTALTRTRPDDVSALWELDLGGVADVPTGSKGWLLVSASTP